MPKTIEECFVVRDTYIEAATRDRFINDERELVDFIGFCGENRCDRAVLYASNVPEEFYHLKTGLAGCFLGKLNTYRVRVVWIVENEKVKGKFAEMVIESNRWNEFHYVATLTEAQEWLSDLKNFPPQAYGS